MRATHYRSRKLFLLITLSGLALGGMVTPIFCQTDTFTVGSGNWSQVTNWSLGALPMSNNDCLFLSNGVIIDDAAGVCQNVTLASGDSLTIATPSTPTSYLYVYGTSLTNPGTLTLTQSSGLHIAGNAGNVVTLSGGGSVVLGGPNTGIVWGATGETQLFNADNAIQGQGVIGQGTMDLTNEKTIMSSGGLLDIQPSKGGLTNRGLMEASSGSTLQFDAGFQTIPFNNAGGTVEALTGSTVNINSGTWNGGTFTTAGTGVLNLIVPAMNGVTNRGTMIIPSSGTPTFEGVTTNSGVIQLDGGIVFVGGNARLAGSGNLLMTGSASRIESLNSTDTFTNQQLIHGSGTIYALNVANQASIQADSASTPLSLTDQFVGGTPTINTGTLAASSGGTLQIENTVHNTGGMITAQTGSTVLLANGVVDGGTFSTIGTGTIQSQNGTLDGRANIPTNRGTFIVPTPYSLSLEGTVGNEGTITLKSNTCLVLLQPTTLTGSGQFVMSATSCVTGSGESFTNQSTIRGAGNIGDSNPMPIVNDGTIMATALASPLTITPDSTGFTNNGTLSVNVGSTLNINGAFNNFANKTLTGGIYSLSGTLEFSNASIAANNGSLTLNGARGQILDNGSLTNALAALALNNSKGIFSLQHGASLATSTMYTNDGKTTIGAGSTLSVGSSYTQSSGTTSVDGTLTAPTGLIVKAGSLLGQGTISAPVTASGGSVTVGDSIAKPGLLTVSGTYTQNTATANLNVAIGGNTAGTQYSQLAVSNGIALDGVLAIKLVNHFVPTLGTSFTILKGSAVSGTFTTVKGTSINSSEHFQVTYQSNEVTLEVVPGP
jgi:hypothetical protein